MSYRKQFSFVALALVLTSFLIVGAFATQTSSAATMTPIKHVVVIFQENVSFDHYFATYPVAQNPAGEPKFIAAKNTPTVNGLSGILLTNNPNQVNPSRLDRTVPITCDQNHEYLAEQQAYNQGAVNNFVQATGNNGTGCDPTQVMGYYDGNTVTALWNYAQEYAMNDNSYNTQFGPSTPGAINLISGDTHGSVPANLPGVTVNGTVISDADPKYDDCSAGSTFAMTGTNVGDLMNANNVTWGWFQGGFAPTGKNASGFAICGSMHNNIAGVAVPDYSAHHEPFQYYKSTSNPDHLPPTSVAMVGHTDQSNHQYDLSYWWKALNANKLPAVSFLKAAKYQDGHAGYSDPLDEQHFLVKVINALEASPYWSNTAIIISYDDSDGWYDHVMPPIVIHSSDPANDAIFGSNLCGTVAPGQPNDRCGYGPRLPLLIISPYSRSNYVDNTLTDQTSVLRFIEDNWNLGRIGGHSLDKYSGTLLNMFDFTAAHQTDRLFLNPITGLPDKDKANLNITSVSSSVLGK
jgi:phospholipase C